MQGATTMQESIAYMATMKAAGPPVHMQLHNLAMRNTSSLLRHPLLLGVNLLSALGVGFLCGIFYYQLGNNLAGIINRAGLVFFAVAYFMLSAQMSLGTIQDERVMLIRERDAGCYTLVLEMGRYNVSRFRLNPKSLSYAKQLRKFPCDKASLRDRPATSSTYSRLLCRSLLSRWPKP